MDQETHPFKCRCSEEEQLSVQLPVVHGGKAVGFRQMCISGCNYQALIVYEEWVDSKFLKSVRGAVPQKFNTIQILSNPRKSGKKDESP